MQRWHNEKRHLERQRKVNRHYTPADDPWRPDTSWMDELGRYRKKKAMDCGKTQCGVCSSHKAPHRQDDYEEIESDLNFREQLREFHEG